MSKTSPLSRETLDSWEATANYGMNLPIYVPGAYGEFDQCAPAELILPLIAEVRRLRKENAALRAEVRVLQAENWQI